MRQSRARENGLTKCQRKFLLKINSLINEALQMYRVCDYLERAFPAGVTCRACSLAKFSFWNFLSLL